MASYTSGFQKTPGGWDWPDDLRTAAPEPTSTTSTAARPPESGSTARPKKGRHYGPRTCRICLETVLPTFHPPSQNLPEMLQGEPTVSYDSEGGRLLNPCRCKGSSKYVHEQCLQEWRHADPDYGKRNYWNCPTCGFRYRLGRMSWAHWISSTATQISLTIFIFLLSVFFLGFVADPIINMYLDPYTTMTSIPSASYEDPFGNVPFAEDDEAGWAVHFVKGFASLGLLGFVKVLFTMGPWNWFSMRQVIGGGARTGNTGRDRMASISWFFVLLGICTFLYTVWKIVRAWSRRVLEKASEVVMDVQEDGEDDGD